MSVHHVVVLNQVLSHVEVMGFDLHLRVLDRLVYHLVFDGNAFVYPSPVHHRPNAVAAEPPHQLVIQSHVESRAPRIALTTSATPQLIVNSPRFVTLGADDP